VTFAEKLEVIGMVGSAIGFTCWVALTIWGNLLTKEQNQHFAEQNQIMRTQGGLSSMPPSDASAGRYKLRYWPFVAMALLMLMTWAAAGFDYYDRHHGTVGVDIAVWNAPLEQVWCKEGQTYTKMTLPLDGKEYVNCRFDQVVFMWHGQKPGRFTKCSQIDSHLESDNFLAEQTMLLIDFFNPTSRVQCGPEGPAGPAFPVP